MDLHIDGVAVAPARCAVRELGYGQAAPGLCPYRLRVPWAAFWPAAAPAVIDMVEDTLNDARLGRLDAEFAWMIEGLQPQDVAGQLAARPGRVLAVVLELVSQEVLFALFPGPWADVTHALNGLDVATLDGQDVVLGGRAYAVRRAGTLPRG